MNQLDAVLDQLNIHTPASRQAITDQILAYAIELTIAELADAGALSEAETAQVSQIFSETQSDLTAIEKLLNTPERRTILTRAMTEATNQAITAARG